MPIEFSHLIKYRNMTNLIRLVKNDEGPFKLWTWGVLKVIHVFSHDLPVTDEITLGVDHVGDHNNLVHGRIGELQGQFGCFYIICHDDRVLNCFGGK